MNEEMITTFTEQTKNIVSPVHELSRLMIINTEKLVALQIASVQSYTSLGFASLKALMEVNNANAFGEYIGKNIELIKNVSDQLADDTKAMADLSHNFTSEAHKIGQESMNSVTEKAA